MNVQELICEFLASSAVADHLGDIRDAEDYLWQALGLPCSAMRDAWCEVDSGSASEVVKYLGNKYNLPFPDYMLEDDDSE